MGGSAPADPASAERMAAFAGFIHGLAGDEPAQSEDCLVLNVWTGGLDTSASRAVMVWVHGGAFDTGSGSWPLYDGVPPAHPDDTLFATINHPLRILGFLPLAQLPGEEDARAGDPG